MIHLLSDPNAGTAPLLYNPQHRSGNERFPRNPLKWRRGARRSYSTLVVFACLVQDNLCLAIAQQYSCFDLFAWGYGID
jgi:hypothetical protein